MGEGADLAGRRRAGRAAEGGVLDVVATTPVSVSTSTPLRVLRVLREMVRMRVDAAVV